MPRISNNTLVEALVPAKVTVLSEMVLTTAHKGNEEAGVCFQSVKFNTCHPQPNELKFFICGFDIPFDDEYDLLLF